jgi:hypothetical protein
MPWQGRKHINCYSCCNISQQQIFNTCAVPWTRGISRPQATSRTCTKTLREVNPCAASRRRLGQRSNNYLNSGFFSFVGQVIISYQFLHNFIFSPTKGQGFPPECIALFLFQLLKRNTRINANLNTCYQYIAL